MGRTGKKKKKQAATEEDPTKRAPKSFIFRRGKVGSTVKQLIADMREVMRPNTAVNLNESASNNIRDFVHVAGPLGVSHFILFSATDIGTYMRIVKAPHGPTLTFRVHGYSLTSDIQRMQQRPHSTNFEYKTAPLLVLNNFGSDEKQVKLMTIAFQNMFPTMNVNSMKVEDCKRVVLMHHDKDTKRVEFRHYLIKSVPIGLSKSIKRVVQKKLESLNELEDISEYVLKGAGASESDLEDMAHPESHVNVPRVTKRGEVQSTKSAIRLIEMGPRMDLELIKIEEGLCDGTVLYHAHVQKSFAEMEALAKKKTEQKKLKEARRAEQERRVKEKVTKKGKFAQNVEPEGTAKDADDDIEWFKQEVGEAPDSEEEAELRASQPAAGRADRFNPLHKKRKGAPSGSGGQAKKPKRHD